MGLYFPNAEECVFLVFFITMLSTMLYCSSFHESTDLAAFLNLFHSFIKYYRCYFLYFPVCSHIHIGKFPLLFLDAPYFWFITLKSQITTLLIHAWMKLIWHVFSGQSTSQPSAFNTRRYLSTMYSGFILNTQITNKTAWKWEKRGTKQTTKTNAYLQYGSWNKKALFNLGWEHVHWVTQIFHCSVSVYE